MQVWIDTDAGIDDALALLLAFKHLDVVGVSCSYGNCPQDMVKRNVTRIVSAFKQQNPNFKVPVLALSATVPISPRHMKPMDAPDVDCFHGHDGLGDVPDFELLNQGIVLQIEFVQMIPALTAQLQRNPNTTVIALGPLTSIRQLQLQKLGFGLVWMGGAFPELFADIGAKGNMGAFGCEETEHNAGCDPVAAKHVLQSPQRTTIVDWDLTLKYTLSLDELKEVNGGDAPNYLQKFHAAISAHLVRKILEIGSQNYICCDALAPYCIMSACKTVLGCVEVNETFGPKYGQTVFTHDKQGSVSVVTEIDHKGFIEKLKQALK